MKVLFLILMAFQCLAETIYVSGEIESKNTQRVLMPLVPSFQGKISEMVEEGSKVEKGDFLLKADGSSISGQIDAQVEQLDVFKSTSKKSQLDLKIQLNQAEINEESAQIKHEIAALKAKVPLDYIGELAFKQNQLALKNAEKTLKKNKNDLNEVKLKILDNNNEFELGLKQHQDKLNYLKETLAKFTINATQRGYAIHATNWRGEKIQIGDQIQSGRDVMRVSQKTNLQIVAWINAIDIPKLKLNSIADIQFDAYMGEIYKGKVIKISSGGEDKEVWGDALYYKVIIEPINQIPDTLLLGMSAMIEINLDYSNTNLVQNNE